MKSDIRFLRRLLSERSVEALVPSSIADKESFDAARTELFALAVRAILIAVIFFIGLYWWLTQSLPLVLGQVVGLVSILLLLVAIRGVEATRAVVFNHLVIAVGVLTIIWVILHTGGLRSPATPWVLLVPLLGYLASGRRAGLLWGLAGIGILLGVYLIDSQGLLGQQVLSQQALLVARLFSLVCLMVIIWMVFFLAQAVQGWLVARLGENEDKLRLVLETAPNGIVTVNEAGRIRGMNQAGEEMFGRSSAEMKGQPMTELIPDLNVVKEATDSTSMEADEKALLEPVHEGIRADGEAFPVSIATGTFQEEDETKHVMILRDDSELQEMRVQMMRLDRLSAVGTLATGVGHEINNPLSYIKGNLEYVERSLRLLHASQKESEIELGIDLDDLLEAIEDGQHGLDRIAAIVSDLRSFAMADSQELSVVDLVECIESAVAIAENEIRHRAQLIRDYDDAPAVWADAGSLNQVLLNLLLNAAQAISDGAVDENEIEVRVDPDDDWIAIVVRDTGMGISEANQERIFDPFFTTKAPDEGTGLGLSISQNIISEMGGTIEVDSEVGEGTTFTIRLPMAEFDGLIDGDERVPTDELPDIEDGRVLVVDDDARVCMALERTLDRAFDVVTETKGEAALKRLQDGENFHIILVDLMMPHLNGMEFFERLAAMSEPLSRRIIFITGGVFTPDAQAFLEERETPCLEKPFDPALMFAMIDELMEEQEEEVKAAQELGVEQ